MPLNVCKQHQSVRRGVQDQISVSTFWKVIGDDPSCWVPASYSGDVDCFPISLLQLCLIQYCRHLVREPTDARAAGTQPGAHVGFWHCRPRLCLPHCGRSPWFTLFLTFHILFFILLSFMLILSRMPCGFRFVSVYCGKLHVLKITDIDYSVIL